MALMPAQAHYPHPQNEDNQLQVFNREEQPITILYPRDMLALMNQFATPFVKELGKVRQQLDACAQENKNLSGRVDTIDKENQTLKTEVYHLASEKQALSNELNDVRLQVNQGALDKQALINQVAHANNANHALQDQVGRIENVLKVKEREERYRREEEAIKPLRDQLIKESMALGICPHLGIITIAGQASMVGGAVAGPIGAVSVFLPLAGAAYYWLHHDTKLARKWHIEQINQWENEYLASHLDCPKMDAFNYAKQKLEEYKNEWKRKQTEEYENNRRNDEPCVDLNY